MREETINTCTVICFIAVIAIESFMIGKLRVIEDLVRSHFNLLYPVFDQIIIVLLVGFFSFFILGLLALRVPEKEKVEK